jgi:hypothetical protein
MSKLLNVLLNIRSLRAALRELRSHRPAVPTNNIKGQPSQAGPWHHWSHRT